MEKGKSVRSRGGSTTTIRPRPMEQETRTQRSTQQRTTYVEMQEGEQSDEPGTPRPLNTELQTRTAAGGAPRSTSGTIQRGISPSHHTARRNIQVLACTITIL